MNNCLLCRRDIYLICGFGDMLFSGSTTPKKLPETRMFIRLNGGLKSHLQAAVNIGISSNTLLGAIYVGIDLKFQ